MIDERFLVIDERFPPQPLSSGHVASCRSLRLLALHYSYHRVAGTVFLTSRLAYGRAYPTGSWPHI